MPIGIEGSELVKFRLKKMNLQNKVIFITLLLSIIFHLSVFTIRPDLVGFKIDVPEDKEEDASEVIRVVLRTEDNKKKQIVNTENNGRKEKPKESKFLGKADQKFDRESVAKKIDSFRAAANGSRDGSKQVVKKKKKMASVKRPKLSLDQLGFKGSTEQLKPQHEISMKALGIKNGIGDKPGLGQNNDYVEDVPLGDMTRLNTVEYKYFGFYDRIRKKLEQFWGSSLREKSEYMYKAGRRMPAGIDRITSLLVTIDSTGNIVDVHVKSTSGITELDEAAIESFNKAGPFPNPPSGMIKNGQATIEWGFVVKS